MLKNIAEPNHPFKKFGTGNLTTLRDAPLENNVDLRQALIKFHDSYYSANVMKLVILGKESIQELAEMATAMFSAVENKNLHVQEFGLPFGNDTLGTLLCVKPIKDLKKLHFLFQIPQTQYKDYKIHPFGYIAHLIGHESVGSILSYLKVNGLASSLGTGMSNYGGRGFDFFNISIELTDLGLEHYEKVALVVFEYIKMLKSVPVNREIYQEAQKMNDISFRFVIYNLTCHSYTVGLKKNHRLLRMHAVWL